MKSTEPLLHVAMRELQRRILQAHLTVRHVSPDRPWMMKLPPLGGLKAFYAAAETGQFRLAAERLGMTESAISHQIRRLEAHLGLQLFDRTGRHRTLTPAAERFFAGICGPLKEIAAATKAIRRDSHRPTVSLTLPTSLAALWLLPRIPAFNVAFPDLDLQLIATNRLCDISGEQIDLGIRYGAGEWTGLDSEFLLNEMCFPVASPTYLKSLSTKALSDLLSSARAIFNSAHRDEWPEWCAANAFALPTEAQAMTLPSSELVLQAAVEGLGIAMGRRPLVDSLLNRGALAAPFGTRSNRITAYHLVWPRSKEMRVPVRRVMRWLKEQT